MVIVFPDSWALIPAFICVKATWTVFSFPHFLFLPKERKKESIILVMISCLIVIVDSNKTQIISNDEFTKQKFIITWEAQEAYAHVSTISYRGAHLCLKKYRAGARGGQHRSIKNINLHDISTKEASKGFHLAVPKIK